MVNYNSRIPQNLEEMLEVANNKEGITRSFGWYYNDHQGWVIPFFTDCSGSFAIPDVVSLKKLICGLQEFCRKVKQDEINEYNSDEYNCLRKSPNFDDDFAAEIYGRLLEPISLVPTPENPGFVYLIESDGYHKIGKTTNIGKRLKALQTASPSKLNLIHLISTKTPSLLEKSLHEKYSKYRVSGEWFLFEEEIINDIIQLED